MDRCWYCCTPSATTPWTGPGCCPHFRRITASTRRSCRGSAATAESWEVLRRSFLPPSSLYSWNTLGVGHAAIVGNPYGGLVALRLALSDPVRVSALGLVNSAGLGRTVSYALRTPTLPGYGELAIAWARTPPGAAQRACLKANLVFAHPRLVPAEWLSEQHRLARTPGFLEATRGARCAPIGPGGQREVLLEELHTLTMLTLLV